MGRRSGCEKQDSPERLKGLREAGFTTKAQRTQRRNRRVVCFIPRKQKRADYLSNRIIGAAIEVHKHLGPGLLESAYETCLEYELKLLGLNVRRQVEVPIHYKGLDLDCAYRIDLLVENMVVLELKAVEKLDGIHEAQLITYLRLSKRWLGFLMNFNVAVLKQGIRRRILD